MKAIAMSLLFFLAGAGLALTHEPTVTVEDFAPGQAYLDADGSVIVCPDGMIWNGERTGCLEG